MYPTPRPGHGETAASLAGALPRAKIAIAAAGRGNSSLIYESRQAAAKSA